jgi:hypothetical protein
VLWPGEGAVKCYGQVKGPFLLNFITFSASLLHQFFCCFLYKSDILALQL